MTTTAGIQDRIFTVIEKMAQLASGKPAVDGRVELQIMSNIRHEIVDLYNEAQGDEAVPEAVIEALWTLSKCVVRLRLDGQAACDLTDSGKAE